VYLEYVNVDKRSGYATNDNPRSLLEITSIAFPTLWLKLPSDENTTIPESIEAMTLAVLAAIASI